MSLTIGNSGINLNGQNQAIFRKMINLGHTYFTLLYLHKGSWALYAFYIFSIKVKYREEYEKNKGKSMLEFVETPSYQASKEAQKMQSEVSPFGFFFNCSTHIWCFIIERSQGSGSECLLGPEDPAQGDLGNHSLDLGTCLGHWALSFSHLGIRPRELLTSLLSTHILWLWNWHFQAVSMWAKSKGSSPLIHFVLHIS